MNDLWLQVEKKLQQQQQVKDKNYKSSTYYRFLQFPNNKQILQDRLLKELITRDYNSKLLGTMSIS